MSAQTSPSVEHAFFALTEMATALDTIRALSDSHMSDEHKLLLIGSELDDCAAVLTRFEESRHA